VDVATVADILALIDPLAIASDVTPRPDSGEKLRPSRDVRVTTSVVLDSALLRQRSPACTAPVDAGPLAGRCLDWLFSPEKPRKFSAAGHVEGTSYPAGVTCATPSTIGFGGCEQLKIDAGTTVRFQRVHERSPVQLTDWYYVRVVRSCTTSCADGETRCASSTTCFVTGTDYCLLCDGRTAAECACQDACAAKADGTTCTYDVSDDQTGGGTCSAGQCAIRP
jgi:hypothetical protein